MPRKKNRIFDDDCGIDLSGKGMSKGKVDGKGDDKPVNEKGIDRSSSEYSLGRASFVEGRAKSHEDCPFPNGWQRMNWLVGFYDARTLSKLRDVFKRMGINWP